MATPGSHFGSIVPADATGLFCTARIEGLPQETITDIAIGSSVEGISYCAALLVLGRIKEIRRAIIT